MAFENFREPELEELIEDSEKSNEWREICENLQMGGQLKTAVSGEDSSCNPIPYMPLNRKWLKIFKTLCSSKSEFKEYSFSTIPLDALKEILLCVHQKYFDKIEIWYDNKEKDPLIIGKIEGQYSSDAKFYLVGRFGDEIMPLEILEQKAAQRLADSFRTALSKMSKTIDELVSTYLNEDEDSAVSISNGHPNIFWG